MKLSNLTPHLLIFVFLSLFISCNKSQTFEDAIGKCCQNTENGIIIGKIINVEEHPVYEVETFRVQDFDNPKTVYYIPVSKESIIDCELAIKLKNQADSLVGKCAYNKSDMKYLGRTIRVNTIGYDSYGEKAEGQFSVTILLEDNTTIDVTYPKYLILEKCK